MIFFNLVCLASFVVEYFVPSSIARNIQSPLIIKMIFKFLINHQKMNLRIYISFCLIFQFANCGDYPNRFSWHGRNYRLSIEPRDQYMLQGEPHNITCKAKEIVTQGQIRTRFQRNVSRFMTFEFGGEEYQDMEKYTFRVNKTTIQLRLPNPEVAFEENQNSINCIFRLRNICASQTEYCLLGTRPIIPKISSVVVVNSSFVDIHWRTNDTNKVYTTYYTFLFKNGSEWIAFENCDVVRNELHGNCLINFPRDISGLEIKIGVSHAAAKGQSFSIFIQNPIELKDAYVRDGDVISVYPIIRENNRAYWLQDERDYE